MGGTSADFSLIADGRVRLINERELHGEILRTPSLDIQTISAGGGSIGQVDVGGSLRVGPASAGSVPGPACYGRGGMQPTLTDAALVMGLLDANEYAGGDMRLDRDASWQALKMQVADPLKLTVEEAAYAMVAIANAQMAQTIRGLAAERGCDLRQFGLVSFGGAGSIFAPFVLARDLHMKEVIVPLRPGVFSASGLMLTDMRYAYQAPYVQPLNGIDHAVIADRFATMMHEAQNVFARDGTDVASQVFIHRADLRYLGQVHELTVELPGGIPDGKWDPQQVAALFVRTSRTRLWLRRSVDGGRGREPAPSKRSASCRRRMSARWYPRVPTRRARSAQRPVYLGPEHGVVEARIYARADLAAGEVLDGPLVINQPDTTIFVLPGQRMVVGDSGVLRLRTALQER